MNIRTKLLTAFLVTALAAITQVRAMENDSAKGWWSDSAYMRMMKASRHLGFISAGVAGSSS